MKLWRARPAAPDALPRKIPTGPERKRALEEAIPLPVEIGAQFAWRLLVIIALIVVAGLLITSVKEIIIPFMIALLISGLLQPFKSFLMKHHWPKWLAVLVAMLLAVVVLGGLILIIVLQVRSGLPALEKQSVKAYDSFKSFLAAPPFDISSSQYSGYLNEIGSAISKNSSSLVSGAGAVASTTLHLFIDFAIVIFSTLFLVLDGATIWRFFVRLFPRRARTAVDGAGHAGWTTLTAFVRVQIVVAAVDAAGIAIAALALQLPLAIPLAILVFIGAFIPVVGAVVTGALAVFVALVYEGPLQAIIMLAVLLIVHLGESHGLQPFLMGNAVKVHPLAVVLAVATGSAVAGISGALFAVPLVAVANVMIKYLAAGDWRRTTRPDTRDVVAIEGDN
jgi:predicted PurR-regulated permease PerM